MAQTDIKTSRQVHKHGNGITASTQWGQFSENGRGGLNKLIQITKITNTISLYYIQQTADFFHCMISPAFIPNLHCINLG